MAGRYPDTASVRKHSEDVGCFGGCLAFLAGVVLVGMGISAMKRGADQAATTFAILAALAVITAGVLWVWVMAKEESNAGSPAAGQDRAAGSGGASQIAGTKTADGQPVRTNPVTALTKEERKSEASGSLRGGEDAEPSYAPVSGAAAEPPSEDGDIQSLLVDLAECQRRAHSAERISSLRPELLSSAAAAHEGITFTDASGPNIMVSELGAEDARALAEHGLSKFREEVSALADRIAARLEEQARADIPRAVRVLLGVIAMTGRETLDLRTTAGKFLIETLSRDAGRPSSRN